MTPAEIKALRQMLNLTIADFADTLDVRWHTVWKWETGRAKPDRHNLKLLQRLQRQARKAKQ